MLNGDHFSSSNKRPRSKTLLSLPSEMRFLVLKFQILGPRCPDNPFDTCCAHRDFNIPRIKEPSFLMGDHSLGLDFDQTELILFCCASETAKVDAGWDSDASFASGKVFHGALSLLIDGLTFALH